jgi:uncharacterized small protein (DUF1192 family)
LSAEEFARLKHDIESKQVEVDRAFARLDDFVRKHNSEGELGSSTKLPSQEVEERLALLEHLMEVMTRLNASYKIYVKMLEKRIGF